MIVRDQSVRIVIATKPVDFRKRHDGLAAMAPAEFGPCAIGGRKGGIPIGAWRSGEGLVLGEPWSRPWSERPWRKSGIVMSCKRLEQGGFAGPKVGCAVMRLSRVQFEALFAGLDWRRVPAPCPCAVSLAVSLRRIPPFRPRQSDPDRLVNMGFCGVMRYEPACRRRPSTP